MRAILIVPDDKRRKLLAESVTAKCHDNDTCTFLLETQDESLNERNTPVLANGAKARRDPLTITPVLESVAPELLTLVADDVFRGGAGDVNSAFEKV